MCLGCRPIFFVSAEGPAGELDLRVGQPSAGAFLDGHAGDLDFAGRRPKSVGQRSLVAGLCFLCI